MLSPAAAHPVAKDEAPNVSAEHVAPTAAAKREEQITSEIDVDRLSDCAESPSIDEQARRMSAALEEIVEKAVERAVEQEVERAVERAMEEFCKYDLSGHIEEQLRPESLEDHDALEELESRLDYLEESRPGVDFDDLEPINRKLGELLQTVDALHARLNSMNALVATCEALERRVAELETKLESRASGGSRVAPAPVGRRPRKRAV